MPLTGHAGVQCQTTTCRGRVEAMFPPAVDPDLWVRVEGSGSWKCSTRPPLPPYEPTQVGYRCPLCGTTFRLMEEAGVPGRR